MYVVSFKGSRFEAVESPIGMVLVGLSEEWIL